MKDLETMRNWRVRVEDNLDLFMAMASDAGYPCRRPDVMYKAKMTQSAGTCSAEGITLSVEYLSEHEDKMVWHTLGHEFAHWIQRCHNLFTFTRRKRIAHNAKFYALCRMLGVSDARCHTMDLQNVTRRTQKRYAIHCDCQTHQVTKNMFHKCTVPESTHYVTCCVSRLKAGPHPKDMKEMG